MSQSVSTPCPSSAKPSSTWPSPASSSQPHWSLARLDAHDQADLVRRGEVEPGALVEAAIQRIEEVDPIINAVSHKAFDHARQAVADTDGATPMAYVPYLLKASIEYPTFPVVAGSRARRDAVASRIFPFVQGLDQAGLIPVGMSTMPEFGLLGTGEAIIYGPTHNPWDLARSSGGSSSGAAAAVATGLVPLAHASDGGGSIRLPASDCGIIGFKPSRGWNHRARACNIIDDILCSDSLYGRSVRDTAWAARHQRTQPRTDHAGTGGRRLRIALDLHGRNDELPDPDVKAAIMDTAQLCESLGHVVEERRIPIDHGATREAFKILWACGGAEVVDFYKATRPSEPLDSLLEPWTIGLWGKRNATSPDALAAAFAQTATVRQALIQFGQEFDVILSPVTRSAPPELGAYGPTRPFEDLWGDLFDHINYTPLNNMAGTPGIALPLFTGRGGLPVGSQFSAAPGGDDLLLDLAAELEAALPWADRWPSHADRI